MPHRVGNLRVLLIEDNPDHAELIQRQLALASERKLQARRFSRLDEGLHELEVAAYDVLLLDLSLPDSDLGDTVKRAAAAAPAIPLVVLTSLSDVEFGVKAVQDGAQDYLVKTQITPELLLRSLRYAIERKRSRMEVERYAAELERSNRDLEQFARVVSHDLKSPLAVIQMDLMMLAEKLGKMPAAAEEYLESAQEQCQHMADLIDGILQLARIQQAPAVLAPLDCQPILQQALENLRAEITAAAANVTYDLLPTVKGEETQLLQLFQNLIGNALKYRSDAPPEIHVSADLYDHEWVFSVADNGLGIAAEDRERVFGMFERARVDTHSGSGIGLATCKRIVERHGGRIWADANDSGGTVIYFALPLAEAARRAHAGAIEE